ncbi:MAG: hypothetical protein AAF773_11165 [Cyanobacteria bacterium P01_D01_bin.115]
MPLHPMKSEFRAVEKGPSNQRLQAQINVGQGSQWRQSSLMNAVV